MHSSKVEEFKAGGCPGSSWGRVCYQRGYPILFVSIYQFGNWWVSRGFWKLHRYIEVAPVVRGGGEKPLCVNERMWGYISNNPSELTEAFWDWLVFLYNDAKRVVYIPDDRCQGSWWLPAGHLADIFLRFLKYINGKCWMLVTCCTFWALFIQLWYLTPHYHPGHSRGEKICTFMIIQKNTVFVSI